MKLALFQTSSNGEILPGPLTDRAVIDISAAVQKGYSPQLTMQGIIDNFDQSRPALEKLAKDGAAVPLDKVRLRPPLPRPGKISRVHCQLLGACAARSSSAQYVHEDPMR